MIPLDKLEKVAKTLARYQAAALSAKARHDSAQRVHNERVINAIYEIMDPLLSPSQSLAVIDLSLQYTDEIMRGIGHERNSNGEWVNNKSIRKEISGTIPG